MQYSTLLVHTLLVFVSRLFIRFTATAAMSSRFTNPPDSDSDFTYTLGSDIQITWESNIHIVSLTLHALEKFSYLESWDFLPGCQNVTNNHSYNWTVGEVSYSESYPSVDIEPDRSNNVYFFAIMKPGEEDPAFSSSLFRIVDQISASTSASASSSSPSAFTGTPTSLSSILASSVITRSSSTPLMINVTQSQNPSSNSGMSRSAKAGIGVGIGIGIPLLLAMGVCLGWMFSRGRITSSGSRDSHRAVVDTPLYFGANNFQQAPQNLSEPRMTNLPDPQVPHQLEESRLDELNSARTYQLT